MPTIIRRKINLIVCLRLEESGWSFDKMVITSTFVNYFKNLFTTLIASNIVSSLSDDLTYVTMEKNENLSKILDKEIKFVVKEMGLLKSLGWDILPAIFVCPSGTR